jgi:hypothetical protein
MPNSRMTDTERDQWMTILDAAAQRPGDEINEEWDWLLERLGLPEDYFLAVAEAIRQGRWRNAKNPRAYVKTVAKREAVKMGLLPEPADILELVRAPSTGEPFSMEAALDHYAELSSTAESVKGADGVWRRGGGYDHESEYEEPENNNRISIGDLIAQGLAKLQGPSAELVAVVDEINRGTDEHHIHAAPRWRPDWGKWAEAAGFDQWDQLVLKCKCQRISREEVMADQPDERSRKAVQAAWRKFDRNGMDRLRAVIKKVNTENVPESQNRHTR